MAKKPPKKKSELAPGTGQVTDKEGTTTKAIIINQEPHYSKQTWAVFWTPSSAEDPLVRHGSLFSHALLAKPLTSLEYRVRDVMLSSMIIGGLVSVHQKRLADLLGVGQPSISKALARLVEIGFCSKAFIDGAASLGGIKPKHHQAATIYRVCPGAACRGSMRIGDKDLKEFLADLSREERDQALDEITSQIPTTDELVSWYAHLATVAPEWAEAKRQEIMARDSGLRDIGTPIQ